MSKDFSVEQITELAHRFSHQVIGAEVGRHIVDAVAIESDDTDFLYPDDQPVIRSDSRHFDVTYQTYDQLNGWRKTVQRRLTTWNGGLLPTDMFALRGERVGFAPNTQGDLRPVNLSGFVVGGLDRTVTLTRLLDESEIASYRDGAHAPDDYRARLWNNTKHAMLHNRASYFEGATDYQRMIKFRIPRRTLQRAVSKAELEVGLYDYQFADREADSPLPVEAEFRFQAAAWPLLRDGYQRWRYETGYDSLCYTGKA